MPDTEKPSAEAEEVRRLAAEGALAGRYREGLPGERWRLRSGAVEIAAPLVFQRVTRPVELKRGHYRCASGLPRLADSCLDRFHDDLDAVLDSLFSYARVPVVNLDGWLSMQIPRAVVDGYRRRRGQRGAQQRPRVAAWLEAALGHDPWLALLARAILDWVGTDATAGGSVWPLAAWAELRAAVTGDHASNEAAAGRDVETVLAAMRQRAAWYEKNIDLPLGRKPAPLWFPAATEAGPPAEPEPFVPVPPSEQDEALLQQLATAAIELITSRIDSGEDPAEVVPGVLGTVFGPVPASHSLNRPPGAPDSDSEQVITLISDPVRLAEVTTMIIKLMADRDER